MSKFGKLGRIVNIDNFKKSSRNITQIIVHCSATPRGRENDAKDINAWHKNRGWSGIGYHYVILPSGEIQYGRNVNYIGAHVKGYNKNSIGICVVGGTDENYVAKEDYFTADQMVFLESFLVKLHKMYPKSEVLGHRDIPFVLKMCPCMDVKKKFVHIIK